VYTCVLQGIEPRASHMLGYILISNIVYFNCVLTQLYMDMYPERSTMAGLLDCLLAPDINTTSVHKTAVPPIEICSPTSPCA
jgi:hypothetical protein